MVTLGEWWSLDEGAREVVMDQLLERVPPGYIDPRSTGHEPTALPQFVHEATGVLFHVVFGGPAVIGMSEKRFERLRLVTPTDDEDLMVPVAQINEANALRPARSVRVKTALVASEPLSFGVLRKLGLDESRITISAVSPVAVGALLKALTPLKWRAPSEAEWEYAVRAVDLESGVAIVEEGHVVDAQHFGKHRVALVARGADRIEPLAPRLQLAAHPVELARQRLRAEQRRRPLRLHPHILQPEVRPPPRRAVFQCIKDLPVDLLGGIKRHCRWFPS